MYFPTLWVASIPQTTIFPLIRSVTVIGGSTNLRSFSGFSSSVYGLEHRLRQRRKWVGVPRRRSVSTIVCVHPVAKNGIPSQERWQLTLVRSRFFTTA